MWQELRNQAAATCFEYIRDAGLLGPLNDSESSQKIKTWVPDTLKAQMAAYALQWHRAIPLRGIIIGQSPTPYEKGNPSSGDTAPHLAASLAFTPGMEGPAASHILANEFHHCGKDKEEALEAIRDCWKMVDKGVLSVHALPLGLENRFDWSPASESDTLQMQILARALCQLVCLSAEMGSRGTTRVVAMGRWAHDVSTELRRQFNDKLHLGQSKYWSLDIRASLSHPSRTWHKFQTRSPDQITLGKEEDLLALYELFLPHEKCLTPTTKSFASDSPTAYARSGALQHQGEPRTHHFDSVAHVLADLHLDSNIPPPAWRCAPANPTRPERSVPVFGRTPDPTM